MIERDIRIKQVYESPSPEDGFRVLVDRLWPRGVSKKAAAVDRWMKNVSPSHELRKWFDHDPAKWDELLRRYAEELHGQGDAITFLRERARSGPLTLVFAARDTKYNNAAALRAYLLRGDEVA